MSDGYGILLSAFWTGATGRELQARGQSGKDPMLLALFLSANEFANMIGLYELSFAKLERSLPILRGRASITKALAVLSALRFADYDPTTEFVWVRQMARVRMQLQGAPLKADDKRRLGAAKLYRGLPLNPFLGPFFDRYSVELGLSVRRTGGPFELQGVSEGVSQGHTDTVSEGLTKGLTEPLGSHQVPVHQVPVQQEDQKSGTSTSEEREQRPNGRDHSSGISLTREQKTDLTRTPADDGNFAVLVKLTNAVMDAEGDGDPTNPDIIEAVKVEAAKARIAYQPDVLNRAMRSAGSQRVRGRASSGSALAPLADQVRSALDKGTLPETLNELSRTRRR